MDLNLICEFILQFFLFSCLGWLTEVTLKYIQFHRFINRGFLIGPYCPIYGWGAVTVTLLVGGLIARKGTVWETFLAGMVLCGALEYFTSWYMEKRFHARWWDYSQKPMNLHGRIWIGNLLLFGAACVIIVQVIDPVLFGWMDGWSPLVLRIAALTVAAVMLADYVTAHFLMGMVRRSIDDQPGDNTEEITKQVHILLHNHTLLLRRLHQAYPDLRAYPQRLTKQLQETRKAYKQAAKQVKQTVRQAAKAQKKGLEAGLEARLEQAMAVKKEARAKLKEIQQRLTIHRDED